MSIINNTNSPIIPITITSNSTTSTSSTPTLLSTPSSSYSSPSPPSSSTIVISPLPPSMNHCDQGGIFVTNNVNYEIGLEMIGGNNGVVVGSNDNVISNIDNNIDGINNDLSSNQLDQQQQPNYFTSYHQNSSAGNIYFLAKANQNQLLEINSNDNSNKIIVPAQHHQQPIEPNDNDNNNDINNIINQSHHQLQLQQLQPNFHHIPHAQLTTRSSTPNLRGSSSSTIIDPNKIINKQLNKSDRRNQRSMPNMQFHAKAHKNIGNISNNINNVVSNNNINNVVSNNNISNVGNPIFLIDHHHNNSLSTPNTPTLPHSEQNNHNNHSNNGNNSNFPLVSSPFSSTPSSTSTSSPPSSSSLLKPPNQIPHKGHWRKRSLSAPTPYLINQIEQSGIVIPSSPSPSLHQHHHYQQQQYCHLYHRPINCLPIPSPFTILKPNVSLPPIQIQRNPKHSQSTPTMSSEECQRKLNEELEKVDFSDITVSELKELLRQRGKPATGKKSILMQRLQEEVELVKAMKSCTVSNNNKDGNGNNNNTRNDNVGNNNTINTINTTNTNSNNDNDYQQQKQSHQQFKQQYQPMITSQTSRNSNFFVPPTLNSTVNPNSDDVSFPNNCMTINNNATGDWPDVNFSLLQQNINDSNNITSQSDFFFQKHSPTSVPAVKTKIDFASLTNSHNNIIDNDNIIIKDEEMSNSDNSGDVSVDAYNIYSQQSSTAPPMITELSNFGFTNPHPHPHYHGDLSFQLDPQNNHHFLNLYNNNQQQQEENLMMIKIEENNLGVLNYPSTMTPTTIPHTLNQQSNQNHIPMQIGDVDMSFGEGWLFENQKHCYLALPNQLSSIKI